jgi:hypothetical protein
MSHFSGIKWMNPVVDRLDPPKLNGRTTSVHMGDDNSRQIHSDRKIGGLYELIDIYRQSMETFLLVNGIDPQMISSLGELTGFTLLPKILEHRPLTKSDYFGGLSMGFFHTLFFFVLPTYWASWMIVNIIGNILGWSWIVLQYK